MDSTNMEKLQAEMSLFWGSHAPSRLRDAAAEYLPPHPYPHATPYLPSLPPHTYLSPFHPFNMDRANLRRTRVCKRCKFSTSDAKEFLHHQINAHSESVEVHQCDKCDFVTAVYTELVSHRRVHRQSSVSTRQPSTDSDNGVGLVDDDNNNEKSENAEADDDYPCSPASQDTGASCSMPASKELISTRNYTCTQCGFKCTSSKTHLRHMVAEHGADYEIHECDVCDYATRYKHKLPRHRECHFASTPKVGTSPTQDLGKTEDYPSPIASDNKTLMIAIPGDEKDNENHDENGNQMSSNKSRILPRASTEHEKRPYESLTQHLNSKGPAHMSGGQMHQSAATNKVMSSILTQGAKSRNMSGLNGSPSLVPPKPKPTCTPVREAVDPAKYVTIREPDGVKYACSKCGNIYKWRKSLNKHWKEKHDGEIPDPRSNYTPLSIPRVKDMKPKVASQSGIMGTLSASVARTMNTSSLSRNRASEAFRAPMLSQVLRRPPMLDPYQRYDDLNKRYMSPSMQLTDRSSPDTHPSLFGLNDLDMSERDILAGRSTRPPARMTDSPLSANRSAHGPYTERDEDVLDLSRKPTSDHQAPLAVPSTFQLSPSAPPQDEPLDFSKKSSTNDHAASAKSPKEDVDDNFNLEKFSLYSTGMIPEQTGALSLQCPSCAYIGRNKQDYDNHMELHLRKRHYKCAECQQVFFTINELNDHFLENHVEVLQTKAVLAGMGGGKGAYGPIAESTQLYKYLTMDNSKQLLSCIICGAIFQWQWTLAKHFEQDHPTLPNPYRKRPVSNINMLSGAGMEPNSKRARNMEQDLQCGQCAYTTKCQTDMKRHELKHTLTRHYSCKLCEYETKHKDELLLHYKSSHSNMSMDLGQLMATDDAEQLMHFMPPGSSTSVDLTANDTAIVIPQAPEETSKSRQETSPSSKSRTKGSKVSGSDNNSAESLLPFKCSVCEYRARWPSEITQHMKNHSDEKPFLCPRCSYRSKWKWDVVKHLKRCGGGTVKDVIDTTKMKKQEQVKALLAEVSTAQDTTDTKVSVNSVSRGVLSNGPPNVTVVPSMKLPTSTKSESIKAEVLEVMDVDQNSPEHSDSTSALAYLESKLPPSESSKNSSVHSLVQGQQHYCLQCPFVGNSPAELKRHSRVHSDEKPFICKTCGYCSKWKCDLKKHLRTYNHTSAVPLTYGGHGRKPADWSEDDKATLKAKGKSTGAKSSDEQDDSSAEVQGVYRCSKCSFVAYKRDVLDKHMKTHQAKNTSSANAGKLVCKKCNFEAPDLSSFLQHKLSHTQAPQNSSIEDIGQDASYHSVFPNANKHRRKASKQFRVVPNAMENFESSEEGSGIDESSFLASSYNSTWQDLANESEEDMSLSAASEPEDLSKTACKQGAGAYKCKQCSYSTVHKTNFEKHMASEHNVQRYSCEWCDWSTDRLKLLYRHAQSVHFMEMAEQDRDEATNSSTSDKVKLSFAESLELRPTAMTDSLPAASIDKDEDSVSEPEAREYLAKTYGYTRRPDTASRRRRRLKTCQKCGYITDNMTTLQRHMSKHGGRGKFTCQKCDYSVDRQHILQYHVKIVHEGQDLSGPESVPSPSEAAWQDSLSPDADNSNQETADGDPYAGDTESEQGKDEQPYEEDDIKGKLMEKKETEKINSDTKMADTVGEMGKVKGQEMRIIRQGKKVTYGCPKCPFETHNVTNAGKHLGQHGLGKKYQCEHCDYSQDQLRHVLHHTNTVHVPKSKRADNLNDSNHENENPNKSSSRLVFRKKAVSHLNKYHCHKCAFSTLSRVKFLTHQSSHNSGTRKNRCSECGHKATTSRLLRRHMQQSHHK